MGTPPSRSILVAVAASWLACAALARAAEPGAIAYLAYTGDYWQVWTVAPDGSDARQVTRSPYEKTVVSWFPDGRHLLVNGLDGRISRVDRDSGEETELRIPLSPATDAVLSPDGTRIAFSISTAGSIDDNEIWTVGVDGLGLQKLTSMPWLQHDPKWSADGKALYFLSGDGGQAHDVWRVSVETKTRKQLTADSLYHFDLDVAPDGRLAFSSNRSGNYEIYVQGDDGEPAQVTRDPALDGGPSFSPDGRALAFHSLRSGELQVWRVEPGGKPPVQLTRHDGGARSPVWWRPAGGSR